MWWRAFALGVVVVGSVEPALAQDGAPDRFLLRAGLGVSSTDYTCTGCTINAETGLTALAAGALALGRVLTAGLEATLSRATGEQADLTLIGALATAGARSATRVPVWGTVGLGWVWYAGAGPNSDGPALTARAGVDIPFGPDLALSPYAGYLTMLGHDGPRALVGPIPTPSDPGVATRVASLQLGLALTVRP